MQSIVIDCRFASEPVGLGRYTRELVTHLLQRTDAIRYHLIVRSENEEWLQDILHPNTHIHALSVRHYSVAEQLCLPSLLKRTSANLFFSPHFNVPLHIPLPYVVTIHDLILHRFPNNALLHKQWAYRYVMSRAVSGAQTIIAVSKFTASEISAIYGTQASKKARIVLEGVSDSFHPQSDTVPACVSALNLDSYFLYVGNAKEHKNVPLLLSAFARLSSPKPSLVLVCGGREARSLRLPDNAYILSHVPDTDLPALYSHATCFVTASLYEGFCLPVAEALACGCPVIASNCGAIPEVSHGRAVLLEPTIDAFVQALRSPPARSAPFCIRGWQQTANETAQLLQDALARASSGF